MKHTIKYTLLAIALAGSMAASASTTGISVKYKASELNSEEGRMRVYGQIQDAAREICGPEHFSRAGSHAASYYNKACFAETMTRTVDKIDNDALTALHERS